MNLEKTIQIGWAWTDITPHQPVYLAGQLYPRVSQYVQDPITATVLALQSDADQAVLISADMVSVPLHVLQRVRQELHGLDGLDGSKISFSVTHTHNSSLFGPEKRQEKNAVLLGVDLVPQIDVPDDILTGNEAADFLYEKIAAIVRRAWLQRKPGGISCAHDYAAVAFNRRPVFQKEDGEMTVMYGDCSQDNFIRLEGPADHAADMIFTWDDEGRLNGLVAAIPCPSQVYELHQMVTADYWTETRRQIRAKLGPLPILPLCGAAGDQNPLDLIQLSKYNQKTLPVWSGQTREVQRNIDLSAWCGQIGSRITEAVMRGHQVALSQIERDPVLRHCVLELDLPLRQVTEADYLEARAKLESAKSAQEPGKRLSIEQVVRLFEPMGVIDRWQLQQTTAVFRCSSHILRIGQTALVTNPFELFCEYSLRIKARSRADQTIVIQLTDGSGGYLPTHAALQGGSYSSKPASTQCGPTGGDLLVAETLQAIGQLWS